MYESRQQELAFRRVRAWSPTLRPGRTTSARWAAFANGPAATARDALTDAAEAYEADLGWWA